MIEETTSYDYAVVGAGVHGLSTAYHLSKTKAKVAIFEQFTVGHNFGSSHGGTRIIRSLYPDQFYADLAKLGNEQYWPEVQSTLNSKFIYSNPKIHLEHQSKDCKKIRQLCKVYQGQIFQKPPQQLKKEYPTLPDVPPGCQNGFIDIKAGVVHASNYVSKVCQYLRNQPNVTIYENTEIKDVRGDDKQVYISTDDKKFVASRVALTCGKWIGQLVPDFKQLVTPVQQLLVYLEMKNHNDYKLGTFPSFFYKDNENQFFGLPDIEGKEIKIGSDFLVPQPPEIVEKRVLQFVNKYFKNRVKRIVRTETCYYTMSKEEDFIIDWTDPGNDRILACSSCSGHSFKFTPVLGKIFVDLLTKGKSIDLFEKYRHLFRIAYHQGVNLKP